MREYPPRGGEGVAKYGLYSQLTANCLDGSRPLIRYEEIPGGRRKPLRGSN